MRLGGFKVRRGVSPSESRMWKVAKGDQRGGKRVGSGGPEGLNGKQRGTEGLQGARRAGGANLALALALASQTQGGSVLFGFQSEIRDAGVLAGGLGCGGGSHHRGGGG